MEESEELWGEDDVLVLRLPFLCSFGCCSAYGAGPFAICSLSCFLTVFAGRIAMADGGCS